MIVPVYPQAFIKFLYLKTWLHSHKIRLKLTDTLSLACRAGTVGSLSAGAADTAYTAWARLIGSYRTVLTWCRTSWTVLTYGKMALRGGTGDRGQGKGDRGQGTGDRGQEAGDRRQGTRAVQEWTRPWQPPTQSRSKRVILFSKALT